MNPYEGFPLWAELLVSGLVLLGSLLALIGSFGLVHLKSFFQRIHAPTLVATMGMWCITLATIASASSISNTCSSSIERSRDTSAQAVPGVRHRIMASSASA